MVTDFEFACLVVVTTLASYSYFYNAKRGYFYLKKPRAIAFLIVLAFQLTLVLLIRYLNLRAEIYYLIPFNIYYISVFYQALINSSIRKGLMDYLAYSMLLVLISFYFILLQQGIDENIRTYYLIYQGFLLLLLLKCTIRYGSTIEHFKNPGKKWYFQGLVLLSIIQIGLFAHNILTTLDLYDIQIISSIYLLFISIALLIFMGKVIVTEKDSSNNESNVLRKDFFRNNKQEAHLFKTNEKEKPKEKYQKSKLKEDDIGHLKKKVQRIAEEQLYLDPELNLDQLSDHLKVSKYALSQFFSIVYETNFKDYINYLRCEHALKHILEQNSTQNILEIAYQSGFNSKTSFYRAFNKVFNCTPLEYKQRNLN